MGWESLHERSSTVETHESQNRSNHTHGTNQPRSRSKQTNSNPDITQLATQSHQ